LLNEVSDHSPPAGNRPDEAAYGVATLAARQLRPINVRGDVVDDSLTD
jgi:hypothetical protein